MRNSLIAEFIGTYFLCLLILLCITPPGAAALTPVAVGLGLAGLVYSCGHLSKAHFNPATTVAYLTARTHPWKSFIPYVITIFVAAPLPPSPLQYSGRKGSPRSRPWRCSWFAWSWPNLCSPSP